MLGKLIFFYNLGLNESLTYQPRSLYHHVACFVHLNVDPRASGRYFSVWSTKKHEAAT